MQVMHVDEAVQHDMFLLTHLTLSLAVLAGM